MSASASLHYSYAITKRIPKQADPSDSQDSLAELKGNAYIAPIECPELGTPNPNSFQVPAGTPSASLYSATVKRTNFNVSANKLQICLLFWRSPPRRVSSQLSHVSCSQPALLRMQRQLDERTTFFGSRPANSPLQRLSVRIFRAPCRQPKKRPKSKMPAQGEHFATNYY